MSTSSLLERAPASGAFGLAKRITSTTQDWLATGASVSGVLGAMVVFDVVQRVAWRVGPSAQQNAASAMAKAINTATRLAGARISVSGLDKVDFGRNYIVVSNHQSMFDISLLSQHLQPLHPRYVSKRELAHGIPGVSYNLRRGGSALIDRKNPDQARKAIADLTRRIRDERVTAVIFPEGTRSKNGAMKPFKSGGLRELVRGAPAVPILPVTSYGGSLLFSKNLRPVVRNVELGMVFHPPQATPNADDEAAFNSFLASLERTIASGLPS
jgi:1-acyl-sn-glycerol-3-phosphate acyltransferase